MGNNLTIFGGSVDKNLNRKLFNLEKQLSDMNATINAITNNSITLRTALTDINNTATITIPAGYSIDTASINIMANDGSFNLKMLNDSNSDVIVNVDITNTNDGIATLNYMNVDITQSFTATITLSPASGTDHRVALAFTITKRV